MSFKLPKTDKLRQAAANSFGSGHDLEGMFYNGKEIGSKSTRKNIVCLDGTVVPRKGAYIQYYETDWDKIYSLVKESEYHVYKYSDDSWSYHICGNKASLSWEDEVSVFIYLYEKIMTNGDN